MPGAYRAEILIDGQQVADQPFEVYFDARSK